ncbi:MAG TPA: TetR/AcrR family transcriptional regulator [Chthoniobacterales bacterium]
MSSERKPSNQELRARKDLLLAASRLMKQGRKPSMDEVAKEALVSRATAYRYFGSIDALLVEAPLDAAIRNPEEIFANNPSDDPEARVDQAEASLHEVTYENEAQLRILLAKSISRNLEDDALPARQNRRTPLIEAALATSRHRFRDDDYNRLCAALAIIFGPESMIVFCDVLRIDEKTARQVKSWAVRALVRAALQSSKSTVAPRLNRSKRRPTQQME